MKRMVLIGLLAIATMVNAQALKPYILGAESSMEMASLKDSTRARLADAQFKILGEYMPAEDETRWVMVITHDEILTAVQTVGGSTAFASALRLALTEEEGQIKISYTDPDYLAAAYFQREYDGIAPHYSKVGSLLKSTMPELGRAVDEPFGMEEGMTTKELGKYHYMFGMEYFEDVVELTEFSSYEVGKSVIRSKLKKGGDTELVYALEIPGQNATLYGIALKGSDGEGHFLPIIDIGNPRHTAFLPYEILLLDNKAIMMHGRYRIALAFPDLTMTTFGKIMSTPGDIEDLMRSVTE